MKQEKKLQKFYVPDKKELLAAKLPLRNRFWKRKTRPFHCTMTIWMATLARLTGRTLVVALVAAPPLIEPEKIRGGTHKRKLIRKNPGQGENEKIEKNRLLQATEPSMTWNNSMNNEALLLFSSPLSSANWKDFSARSSSTLILRGRLWCSFIQRNYWCKAAFKRVPRKVLHVQPTQELFFALALSSGCLFHSSSSTAKNRICWALWRWR